MFAHDTSLTLKYENGIQRAIQIIVEEYAKFSGLKLDKHKSEVTWLGRRKGEHGQVSNIPMKSGMYTILGIYFSAEKEASLIEENWKGKIENVERIIRTNGKDETQHCTNKFILANTMLLFQFSHALQVLSFQENVLRQINTNMYTFLWKHNYMIIKEPLKR